MKTTTKKTTVQLSETFKGNSPVLYLIEFLKRHGFCLSPPIPVDDGIHCSRKESQQSAVDCVELRTRQGVEHDRCLISAISFRNRDESNLENSFAYSHSV